MDIASALHSLRRIFMSKARRAYDDMTDRAKFEASAAAGDEREIDRLLARGIVPDRTDAMALACSHGRTSVAKLLIASGANIHGCHSDILERRRQEAEHVLAWSKLSRAGKWLSCATGYMFSPPDLTYSAMARKYGHPETAALLETAGKAARPANTPTAGIPQQKGQ
jgi:hypothetical protein